MNLSEHRTDLVRCVASASSLFGVLVGVPLLLILGVGWPLPDEIPSGSEVLTALKTGAFSPSLILKPISVVVWVLWLQMLSGVGIELWAHFQGRVAPRVSFIPSFMQRMSARLMGTVLVIAFSIQQPGAVTAANQDLLAPTAAEIDADPTRGIESTNEKGSTTHGEEVHFMQSTDPARLVHTVSRRDSLQVLAERYLGNPDRWTEVFVLNQGKLQADGEYLTDPARLQPGWELVMPADAHPPISAELNDGESPDSSQQPDAPYTEPDDSMVTVQEGDTLWGLAAHHLNDPQKWVDIFNSNQDLIQDPSVILPGWQLQMPTLEDEPAISPSTAGPLTPPLDHHITETQPLTPPLDHHITETQPLTPPLDHRLSSPPQPPTPPLDHLKAEAQPKPPHSDRATRVAAYAASRPIVMAGVAAPDVEQRSAPSSQTMFAVGGLGVFASSLGWVLARLRRTQRRRMPTGRMPVPPSETAVQLNQELQAAADPDSALFLDASLRVLSSRIAGNPPPEIIGATLSSNGVSIHLSAPGEAPPGFHPSDGGATWTLPRDAALESLLAEADGVPAPLPTLATIGTLDGQECLVNLEHLVVLSLEGDPEAIAELCSAMATQLASSHLADDLTVLCVGFGQDLAVFERVDYVPDVVSAIERIEHQQRQNQAMLGSHPDPLVSRLGSNDDFWHPMVALVPNRVDEQEAAQLLEVCDSSVCTVAHGLDGATWVGRFDEGVLLLHPIGLRLEPCGLSANTLDAVAELASSAKDTEGMMLAVPPSSHLLQDRQEPADDVLDFEIEVRVIGTVEMVGAAQPFTSRRALDLVAYLAFHPEGADRDQLMTHIWPPDDPPSKSTLANTVSRARRALGTNRDNEPYLPRVTPEGIYRLAPGVGTDVSRFEALVSDARSESGDRGRDHLQSALTLVRGTPFTGGAGDLFRWADFGLRTHIDCLVDTAAHELAKRCLDAGDVEGARHAVMTSLQLVGVCEQCYRWRLMAAAENPTEVRQIMAELLNLLKRESNQPEADDLISPDLLELYEELMSGRSLFK